MIYILISIKIATVCVITFQLILFGRVPGSLEALADVSAICIELFLHKRGLKALWRRDRGAACFMLLLIEVQLLSELHQKHMLEFLPQRLPR
jgi:hypothetical protein